MKRKKENKNNDANALEFIIESRLSLQSVQRYLDANKVPATSKFIKSEAFKRDFYNNWPEYKKKDFLQTMAGLHWKKMQELIEG